jgi:hypothetical protein
MTIYEVLAHLRCHCGFRRLVCRAHCLRHPPRRYRHFEPSDPYPSWSWMVTDLLNITTFRINRQDIDSAHQPLESARFSGLKNGNKGDTYMCLFFRGTMT